MAGILSAAGDLPERLPDGLALQVRATDTGESWSAAAAARADGGAGASRSVAVAAPSWAIAAWLVGRPGPVAESLSVTGGELPLLKPWR